jgi:hypothetical protein
VLAGPSWSCSRRPSTRPRPQLLEERPCYPRPNDPRGTGRPFWKRTGRTFWNPQEKAAHLAAIDKNNAEELRARAARRHADERRLGLARAREDLARAARGLVPEYRSRVEHIEREIRQAEEEAAVLERSVAARTAAMYPKAAAKLTGAAK